jgi:hypothetical protein
MAGLGYDMNAFATQQPPQIFGAYDHNGSPMGPMGYQGAYFGDSLDGGLDDNDPKRRRIARVRIGSVLHSTTDLTCAHRLATCMPFPTSISSTTDRRVQVPEEENKVRRKAAQMLALYKLQDRVCLHAGREEEEPAERVGGTRVSNLQR